MLSDEDLYVFDTTGFLVVRGAFDADEVRRFRAELDELSATEPYANTERFDDLTAHSPTFGKLALDDRVVGRARDVINQPMRLLEAYALRRQRHSALYLHGGYAELLDMPDRTVGRDLSIMHTYHDGRIYCTYVKALIYLSAIRTQEDGSFCYLHGSHKANFPLLRARARRGERRSLIDEGFPTLADVFVEAGDLLLLNEALMHGTRRKLSDGDRTLLAFSYGPTFLVDWRELDGETADLRGQGYVDHDVEEDFVR